MCVWFLLDVNWLVLYGVASKLFLVRWIRTGWNLFWSAPVVRTMRTIEFRCHSKQLLIRDYWRPSGFQILEWSSFFSVLFVLHWNGGLFGPSKIHYHHTNNWMISGFAGDSHMPWFFWFGLILFCILIAFCCKKLCNNKGCEESESMIWSKCTWWLPVAYFYIFIVHIWLFCWLT